MDRRRTMASGSMLLALLLMALGTDQSSASQQVPQIPLPGNSIPKFVDPLPTFVGARVPAGTALTVTMEEFDQQVLPLPHPKTTVWGYKVADKPAHYPGFTVEAKQNTPTTVTFVNNLVGPNGAPPKLQKYLSVDPTLHWANPLGLNCMMMPLQPACLDPYGATQPAPVPAVAHLHGGEVPSFYDGHPEAWFTPDGRRGPTYSSATPVADNAAQYVYPNKQEAATIWFHDHALGMTRLNVYGGLAAFYFMRDGRDTGLPDNPIRLPAGPQEIEMAIQDRLFDTTGQWLFPDVGINQTEHPFWLPEFFGDTIVVNGKTWPFLNVEQRRYRFRIVDGSNARFYQLALVDSVTGAFGPPIWQIGTDGGLLDAPVMLNDPAVLNAGLIKPNFILAPGERADVIIDFTNIPVGTTFVLRNIAKAPFPKGTPANPSTVGQIMQFRVTSPATSVDTSCDPALPTTAANGCTLRAAPIVRLANPATGTPAVTASVKRQLTLVEIMGMGGPLEVLINNTKYNGMNAMTGVPIDGSKALGPNFMTEAPKIGDTEIWEIVNLTADAHPIHLHLVQFQLLNRQPFQTGKYFTSYSALFLGGAFLPGSGPPLPYVAPNADGALGGNPAVTPFLQGVPVPANPNEAGWKDTIIAYPGEVTRFIVRFAPQHVAAGPPTPGTNFFPFDPTVGPGYVWHCHIIDHEDNEMMRPYAPVP